MSKYHIFILIIFGLFGSANSYADSYYQDSHQSWWWGDFLVYTPSGGGNNVYVDITNDVLTVSFNAGFATNSIRTGKVKQLFTNPTLPNITLGMLDTGFIMVSIEDGWLTFTNVGASNSYTGFNITFTKALEVPIDFTNWVTSPTSSSSYNTSGSLTVHVNTSIYTTPSSALSIELYKGGSKVIGTTTTGSISGVYMLLDGLVTGIDYKILAYDPDDPSGSFGWSPYFSIVNNALCLSNVTVNGGGITGDPSHLFGLSASSDIGPVGKIGTKCEYSIEHRWYTHPTNSTYNNTGASSYSPTCGILSTTRNVTNTATYWVSALVYDYQGNFQCESARSEISTLFLTNWVTSPLGGSVYNIGDNIPIAIDGAQYNPSSIQIEIWKGGIQVVDAVTRTTSTASISTTGLLAGTDYQVKVYAYGKPDEYNFSHNFTIRDNTVCLLSEFTVSGGGITGDPSHIFGVSAFTNLGPDKSSYSVEHKWYTSESGTAFDNTGADPYYTLNYYILTTTRNITSTANYWVSELIYDEQDNLICESARKKVSTLFLTNWVTSPPAGSSYNIGDNIPVDIDGAQYNPSTIQIEIWKGGIRVVDAVTRTTSTASVSTTGLLAGTDYQLKVYANGKPDEYNFSKNFTLIDNTVCLSSFTVTGGGTTCDPDHIFGITLLSDIGEDKSSYSIEHRWYTSETGTEYDNTGASSYYVQKNNILSTTRSITTNAEYWVSELIYDEQGNFICESDRQHVSTEYTIDVLTYTANITSSNTQCGPIASFSLSASGGRAGSIYEWYNAQNVKIGEGSTFNLNVDQNDIDANNQYMVYPAGKLVNLYGCEYNYAPGDIAPLVLNVAPFSYVNAGADTGYFSDNGPVTLSGSPAGGTWPQSTFLTGSTFYPDLANAGSHTLTYNYTSGICTDSDDVVIGVIGLPQISFVGDSYLTRDVNSEVTLTVTGGNYDGYQWYRNGGLILGQTVASITVTETGVYKVKVTKYGKNREVEKEVIAEIDGQTKNFIITQIPQKSGYLDPLTLVNEPIAKVNEKVDYFDELGRPQQIVQTGMSPAGNDVVQVITYDEFGREEIKYLPYVASETTGFFKKNAVNDQLLFFQTEPLIDNDDFPFSKKIFEPSPLNRVLEQGATGAAWQPILDNPGTTTIDESLNGKTIRFSYETNIEADSVYQWQILSGDKWPSLGGTGYYQSGELIKNITSDEQGHSVIEFVNRLRQTILRRVQVTENAVIDVYASSDWADTYYIYDDYGNLRYVLPPEAINNVEDDYLGK